MSDSDDDNAYSDYLASRRAAVAKKRPVVDESDDEIDNAFRTALNKRRTKKKKNGDDGDDGPTTSSQPMTRGRRRNGVVADDEDVAEVSIVEEIPRTHEALVNSKSRQMEEIFRKSIYSDDAMLVMNQKSDSDAVKAALAMCENFDLNPDNSLLDESVDPEKTDSLPYNPMSGCVEIDVLDCEKVENGKTSHMVPRTDTFDEVRKRIAATWKCAIDDVILMVKGAPLDADTTPASLGIIPMKLPLTVIEAHRKEVPKEVVVTVDDDDDDDDGDVAHSDGTPGAIMLKVQMKNRKKPVHVAARPEMSLLELKLAILKTFSMEPPSEERLTRLPAPAKMKVMFDDEYLTDDTATVEQIGLEDGDCLDIYN